MGILNADVTKTKFSAKVLRQLRDAADAQLNVAASKSRIHTTTRVRIAVPVLRGHLLAASASLWISTSTAVNRAV